MKNFDRIYVEITNVCNKDCKFCVKTVRPPLTMNVENFSKIIDKIKCYTKYLYLHVMGEPLINPYIGTFLDICEQAQLQVNLNSNGSLLPEKLSQIVNKPSLRKLIISLHSFGANKIHKTEEEINKILECVDVLKQNTIIELRMWSILSNKLENAVDKQIVALISNHYNYTSEIDVSKSKKYKLDENVFLNFGNLFCWPSEETNTFPNGFCYALRSQVAILVDGTVVPCCLDNNGVMKLGNIFNQNLDEIINSKRALNIYNNFTNHKKCENLCLHCSFLTTKNE